MSNKFGKYISFNDLMLLGALLVALALVWNTVGAMQRNYYLQQKYNQLKAEVDLQKIKNQNLRYQIAYQKTDEYLEVQARDKLDKTAPGETLVYLPKNGEAAKAPVAKTKANPTTQQATGWKANIDDWWQFFRGKHAVRPT